ncbi:peroxidasin-like [Acropora millepora]|uniref:peroxidasin-like n=1 Tax=Acropora millepora TaxID=45264 RepID=UPI001CF51029|nr:peroxidasin-like [Acropora millepora]
MNIDHLKLLCEFKKYEVMTVSVVGGQSNKQRCLLKRVDFFPFSDKPAFTTHPQNKTVREGDPVTLFCNATGNPKPSISWTIDGLPVNITVHSRISLTADNKQLTVKDVNRTDSHHKYRCLARNSIGTITSYAASLTIQYKPAIATYPRSQTVREGNSVTLFCNATGNPKPSISWTIDWSTVNFEVHSRVSLGPHNKQLTVKNVNRTDSNHQYRCLANNSVETITSDAVSLNVQYKPAFATHPRSQTVREGDNVTLSCHATGNPKPTISWTIDGSTVNIKVHPRVSLGPDNKQLTVRNVKRTDSNHQYRCLANNSVETITSDAASLNVQSLNASPYNVTGHTLSSTSIFVSWGQVPFLHRNGVILSYTVTYTALPSGSSQTKNVTAPANQTTLTGLNEYTNYRAKCSPYQCDWT